MSLVVSQIRNQEEYFLFMRPHLKQGLIFSLSSVTLLLITMYKNGYETTLKQEYTIWVFLFQSIEHCIF